MYHSYLVGAYVPIVQSFTDGFVVWCFCPSNLWSADEKSLLKSFSVSILETFFIVKYLYVNASVLFGLISREDIENTTNGNFGEKSFCFIF